MKHLRTGCLALAVGLAGCNESRQVEYPDPTSLQSSTTQNGITLEVVSPISSFTTSPQVEIDLRVARVGSVANLPLVVRVGLLGGWMYAAEPDATDPERFRRRLTLEHGRNTLLVEVRDPAGRLLRDARFTLRYDGTLPGLAVLALARPVDGRCDVGEPLIEPVLNSESVCVLGRASTSGSAQIAEVVVEHEGGEVVALLDGERRFAALVPLQVNRLNSLRVLAELSSGARSSAAVDVRHDGVAPELVLTEPSDPTLPLSAGSVRLAGTLSDDVGIDTLRLESGRAGVTFLPPEPAWSVDVRLENGANPVRVVAVDIAGNESVIALDLLRQRVIRLRVGPSESPRATLRLDRTALEALITPDEQAQIDLVAVPLRGTIRSALTRLADPEAYGISTDDWGTAERNLQRLLVTTPDTSDLRGSSLEALLTLSDGIGLPAPRLTAQLLDIGVEDRLLPIEVLTDTFLDGLVATHPAVERDESDEPVIYVTLADALTGLRDLGERFGPSGDHPGFVTGETSSVLLEPGFAMTIDASTSLRERQGVDASRNEKDYLYLQTGSQVLSFDFLRDDAFSVVGLVNEPTVDLRIRIDEAPGFVVAGAARDAGLDPDGSGASRGDGLVWQESPWVLERLVAEAAYRGYRDRFEADAFGRVLRYSAGAIAEAAVMSWDRGWVSITTSGGLGAPPPPFYVWDLLTEVAQLRLHDGGLAEGEANVEFVLRDLPVGITADELVEALRPTLQDQAELLSELLLGTSGVVSSGCDFWLEAATDGGEPWLFFRDPSDAPGSPTYARPGFFADPMLAEPLSERIVGSGSDDTVHEKLRARAGQSAYFADDSGQLYRLQVVAADATSADVLVTQVGP